MSLRIAEWYTDAFSKIAMESTIMLLPSNVLIGFCYSLATLVVIAGSPTPSGMIFVLFRVLDLA